MDYIVLGILQARKLEWVACPFSRGSSCPRNWIGVSGIAGGIFTSCDTREALHIIFIYLFIYLSVHSSFLPSFPLSLPPCGSDGKESACSAGDQGSVPKLRRSPGEGNGHLLHYSCLENSMDRGAYRKKWDTAEQLTLLLFFISKEDLVLPLIKMKL